MPNVNDAGYVYEHYKRLLEESVYSQEGVGSIRGDVLKGISWLNSYSFYSFANDLEAQFVVAIGMQMSTPKQNSKTSLSFGTCFVVSPDGLILTAHHVIDGAEDIEVILSSGLSLKASLQQSAKSNDLAVLKVSSPTPNYLSLIPSREAKVGDSVFTMGFPVKALLGEEPKYTDGTISALSGPGGEATIFQTTVPIQPGNSGGPIVNNKGEVVGIVSSTAAIRLFLHVTGSLPQNINWAIKSDYALLLFNSSPRLPPTSNRETAVELVRSGICAIEASSSN